MIGEPLHPTRYLHTIHAALECDRLRNIYTDVFGGIVFSENYFEPEDRDAALLYVADHMIEVMSPRHPDGLEFMYARFLRKAGECYHSISFRVDDCAAAHQRCRELGIAINTTGPGLIFLHPKSTGGIIMEITDNRMPNDPWDLPNWRRDWASGRADRPHGLDHVVCAPREPLQAIRFLAEVLNGQVGTAFDLDWPQPARATPVQVADVELLVLEPIDRTNGPLVDFAAGPNGGVYALAWRVADASAAASRLETKGLAPTEVPVEQYSHALMLDGARHWFRQVS